MNSSLLCYHDYRQILFNDLERRVRRNPRYSRRAYARDLGLSAAGLSRLINGKSLPNEEKCRDLATQLFQDASAQAYFLALLRYARSGDARELENIRQSLSQNSPMRSPADLPLVDYARYLQLSLRSPLLDQDAHEKLSMTREEFEIFSSKLLAEGWLQKTGELWLVVHSHAHFQAQEAINPVRLFHAKVLALAQQELHEGAVDRRYFHSQVFSLNKGDYAELCEEIASFCRRKGDAYQSREAHDMIYALGFQLLPVVSLN